MNILGKPNKIVPEYNGPTNFCWLMPGLLGGVPRPGVFKNITRDLEALRRVGTKLLVTLTSEWEPDADLISQYGMDSLYSPIIDLQPPTIVQAADICRQASQYTTDGHAVVFHCHAGKGRAGTLLASMLIWSGSSAQDAINQTRHQNSKWIQTEGQLDFLKNFADSLP